MMIAGLTAGSSVKLKERQRVSIAGKLETLPAKMSGKVVALNDDGGNIRVWVRFDKQADAVQIYSKYLEVG